jgi:CRISPR-associated protein Cas2
MLVLVSYDVSTMEKSGRTRLRRVARMCQNYGQRVQFSVFECIVDPSQWAALRQKLIDIIDPREDSLRFYFLGANWRGRVEHVGAKPGIDQEGPLII